MQHHAGDSSSSIAAPEIVVFAASAGGLAALAKVLGGLGSNTAAALVIVQHLQRDRPSMLAEILARSALMPVIEAVDGAVLQVAVVHVAPPNFHVVINANRTLSLTSGAPVRFVRPAADTLFKSAAEVYGAHALAVVLTGMGRDASDGVRDIKRHGGRVIAQDHDSSQYFAMPESAIGTGAVDYVLPLDEIAGRITALLEPRSA